MLLLVKHQAGPTQGTKAEPPVWLETHLNAWGGRDSKAKIADVGLSRVLLDTHLTANSVRAFTWDYASPEQIAGAPLSLASDVFSFGVSCQALIHQSWAQAG